MTIINKIAYNLFNINSLYFFSRKSSCGSVKSDFVVIIKSLDCLVGYKLRDSFFSAIKREIKAGSEILVYVVNMEVVGYLCISDKKAYIGEIAKEMSFDRHSITPSYYIYNIFVANDFRGRSIQSILMSSVDFYVEKDSDLLICALCDNYYSVRNILNDGFSLVGFVSFLVLFKNKITLKASLKGLNLEIRDCKMAK